MKRLLTAAATVAAAIPLGFAGTGATQAAPVARPFSLNATYSEAASAATPNVSSVISCLKANGADDIQEVAAKSPARASVSGKGAPNALAGLRLPFLIIFFDNAAAANAFAAAHAEPGLLLDRANGGQTLMYVGDIKQLLPPTEALLSKCVAGQAQAAPGASSNTRPTVSSVVSCLKTGGAWDITIPSTPAAIGGVKAAGEVDGTAPSNPGFVVLLFNSFAQANAYAAKSPAGSGETRTLVTDGTLIDVSTKDTAGVAAAKDLLLTCVGANAGSLPSTARSNPNTVSALVACLRAAKARKVTTPSNPPAYGTVAGYTPSGPAVVVFLFDNIAQANGFISLNEPGNGASVLTANGGVTVIYINTGTAAAVSAAKTLIGGCIKA